MLMPAHSSRIVIAQAGDALPIAVAGLVLSLGSIATNGVLYWLNGSRVRLELKYSMSGHGHVVSFPPNDPQHLKTLAGQGFGGLNLAVEVTNIGRGDTYVVSFAALLNNGMRLSPTAGSLPFNPSLPHHLRPHSQVTLHVPFNLVKQAVSASEQSSVGKRDAYESVMEVSFGNGKKRTTKDAVQVPKV